MYHIKESSSEPTISPILFSEELKRKVLEDLASFLQKYPPKKDPEILNYYCELSKERFSCKKINIPQTSFFCNVQMSPKQLIIFNISPPLDTWDFILLKAYLKRKYGLYNQISINYPPHNKIQFMWDPYKYIQQHQKCSLHWLENLKPRIKSIEDIRCNLQADIKEFLSHFPLSYEKNLILEYQDSNGTCYQFDINSYKIGRQYGIKSGYYIYVIGNDTNSLILSIKLSPDNQDKFWEYMNKLYGSQHSITQQNELQWTDKSTMETEYLIVLGTEQELCTVFPY